MSACCFTVWAKSLTGTVSLEDKAAGKGRLWKAWNAGMAPLDVARISFTLHSPSVHSPEMLPDSNEICPSQSLSVLQPREWMGVCRKGGSAIERLMVRRELSRRFQKEPLQKRFEECRC
jgi:hypothetical protein